MLKRLKSLTKTVVSPLVDSTGWYDRRLRRASGAPGAWTVLMYHRVIDDPRTDPFGLGMCVTRDRFEHQVQYLKSRFQILTVGEAVQRLRSGEALPQRALSITFDDGYRDNLTLALPVMKRWAVPFSVYVPTNGMDEGQPLWWDRVISAIAGTRRTQLDLADVGLAQRSELVNLDGLNADVQVEAVLNRLWSLGKSACDRSVERIEQVLEPVAQSHLAAPRLTRKEVLQLHREGVEIGAHSASHPNLALADEALIQDELQNSRTVLEDLLQVPVTGLAYPGGRVGIAAKRLAEELGFAYALGTESGLNLPRYELMELRRIGMPGTELSDVRRAVSQAMIRMSSDDQLHF
jgi:peptidoglycan/xylan/chitin deacetylase (PgdA/CDA1 family)